jgi:hypothetical protein
MKTKLLTLILSFCCVSSFFAFQNPDEFQVIPGVRVGKIAPRVDEDKLMKIYGAANIAKENIDFKERKNRPATIIFQNTPNEIVVLWQDEQYLAIPDVVIIRRTGGSWSCGKNVKVGMTLAELVKANKKPILFTGFSGSKPAGIITDWGQGTLSTSLSAHKGIELQLNYPAEPTTIKEKLSKLSSNKAYSSSDAAISPFADQLFVSEIVIYFQKAK